MGQNAPTRRQYVLKKGGVAMLRANATGATSFIWYKNNIILPGKTTATLAVYSAGVYKSLATNNTGCSSDASDEIEIIIEDELLADVAITKRSETRNVLTNQSFEYYLNVRNNGKDKATEIKVKDLLPDQLIFESLTPPTDGTANYNANTKTITWDIPQLNVGNFAELVIKAKASIPGLISNTATVNAKETDPNLNNNTATDRKQISALNIPNVFTPNGDGKNDTFTIGNLSSFEQNQLTIINRWQSTVYQTNNYRNDWDGNNLSDGTYFYVIKIKNGNSNWLAYEGYVTILR